MSTSRISHIVVVMIFCYDSLADKANGPEIILYEYSQNNSISNCSRGLISGLDTAVFKAQVNYTMDPNVTNVYFQLMRKSDHKFITFHDFHINSDCWGNKPDECIHIEKYCVSFKIKLLALKEYSGAKIRGVLIKSNFQEITSYEQVFPEVASSKESRGIMIVNSQIASSKLHKFKVGSEINLVYVCQSLILPCWIELNVSFEDGVTSGSDIVVYKGTLNNSNEFNVSIKHGVCSFYGGFNLESYTIKSETKEINYQADGLCIDSKTAVTLGVPLLSIGLLTICWFLRGYLGICCSYFRRAPYSPVSKEPYQSDENKNIGTQKEDGVISKIPKL